MKPLDLLMEQNNFIFNSISKKPNSIFGPVECEDCGDPIYVHPIKCSDGALICENCANKRPQ